MEVRNLSRGDEFTWAGDLYRVVEHTWRPDGTIDYVMCERLPSGEVERFNPYAEVQPK